MFADIKLLSILAVIMPILLVVEMPLFSLKISNEESISSRLNIFRMLLILSAVILFFVFQFAAIPFIVILYLILSLLNNIL
jgi:CDP-diacylglycerol--serine O-phosphatidyltransferase